MTTTELLEAHHKEAYYWARQCCRFDSDLASDALQTAYLKVLQGKARFHGKSSFKTWLFSVIRFTSADLLKEREKRNTMHVGFDSGQVAYFSEAVEETYSSNYEELIKLLPKRQAELLLLVFYHNLTIEAAAEVMQIGVGSARTHYDRGKKGLLEIIQKHKLRQAQ